MGTFLLVAALLALMVWGLGRWRQREIEKFRQTDVSLLSELKREAGIEDVVPQAHQPSPLESFKTHGPGEKNAERFDAELPLKSVLLLERHRAILQALDAILNPNLRVFVNLPMSDVFETQRRDLLSFVICDSQYLTLEAVLEFGDQISDAVVKALSNSGKPLIQISVGMSQQQLQKTLVEQANGLILDRPRCPKCDSEMRQRKPITGKNAGRLIWVCQRFPACRGAVGG